MKRRRNVGYNLSVVVNACNMFKIEDGVRFYERNLNKLITSDWIIPQFIETDTDTCVTFPLSWAFLSLIVFDKDKYVG